MERKQFNVADFISNEETPVETRDGRNVRVLCTDKRGGKLPVVALVLKENNELVFFYSDKGFYWESEVEDEDDLFFTTC